jgi:hypothetical protein
VHHSWVPADRNFQEVFRVEGFGICACENQNSMSYQSNLVAHAAACSAQSRRLPMLVSAVEANRARGYVAGECS